MTPRKFCYLVLGSLLLACGGSVGQPISVDLPETLDAAIAPPAPDAPDTAADAAATDSAVEAYAPPLLIEAGPACSPQLDRDGGQLACSEFGGRLWSCLPGSLPATAALVDGGSPCASYEHSLYLLCCP